MDEKIEFYSQGQRIVGITTKADKGSPYIVIFHGLGGSKDSSRYSTLAETLPDMGVGVLRFDFRAPRDEYQQEPIESDEAPRNMKNMLSDADAAVNFIRKYGAGKIGLLGNSMGGLVALLRASYDAPDTLVTWSAPLHSSRLPSNPKLRASIEAYDIQELKRIRGTPYLLLHNDRDMRVPIEDARDIQSLTGGELVIVEGVTPSESLSEERAKSWNHRFSYPDNRRLIIDKTREFFARNLRQ